MKIFSEKEKTDSGGFVIIFTLIILSMMMVTGFAFVAETTLAKKSSRAYAQAVIVDELSKGILTTINHNIINTLKHHDSGKESPSNNEQELQLINNPEVHSMFHKYKASDNRDYDDIRVSFLSKEAGEREDGLTASPSLIFYLGEDRQDSFFTTPYEYQGYPKGSTSKKNTRTIIFDGIDIHADTADVMKGEVDGDGDGSIDGQPNWDYRYTYMVMSQIGKIDPNYAIDGSGKSPAHPEIDLDSRFSKRTVKKDHDGDPSTADLDVIDCTKPNSYSELTLVGAIDDDLVENIQDKIPQQIGWSSFTAFSEGVNLTAGSSDLRNSVINSNYYAFYPHSIEEYLPEIKFDSVRDEDNSANNFKYSLSDINRVEHDQISPYTPDNSVTDVKDNIFYTDEGDTASASMIDLLEEAEIPEVGKSNEGKLSGLGCSSHEQLAANILDVVDDDWVCTTNVDSSGAYNEASSINFIDKDIYCGVEQGPRINEIHFRVSCKPLVSNPSDGAKQKYEIEIGLDKKLEIYCPPEFLENFESVKTAVSSSDKSVSTTWIKLQVQFTKATEDGPEKVQKTFRENFLTEAVSSTPGPKYNQGQYLSYTRTVKKSNYHKFIVEEDYASDFAIEKIQMSLYYHKEENGKVVGSGTKPVDVVVLDFSKLKGVDLDKNKLDLPLLVELNPTNKDIHQALSMQAKNPIFNNTIDDWGIGFWYNYQSVPKNGKLTADGSLGEENTNYVDGSNLINTDKQYSRGYIRNNTPESLLELGSIGTGNPYQTIDLLYIPEDKAEEKGNHFFLVNLLRLGDGHGMEEGGKLKAITNRRLNPNTRFPNVLLAAFSGIPLPGFSSDYIPSVASDEVFDVVDKHKNKIENLVKKFPGILSKDEDFLGENNNYDFSAETDSYDVETDEAKSIFGRAIYSGSAIPDRNPIAYRRPFAAVRGDGIDDLSDAEAEQLFWQTKDMMGAMNYFSVIYSVQPGRGTDTTNSFTPSAGWSTYRAEVAYGLNPDDKTRKKMQTKVLLVRKTK